MPWNLMVRDLLLILSWIGNTESHTDDTSNSSIFFKKSNRNLKFRQEAVMLGSQIYRSSHFYSRRSVSLFSALIWTKWCPRKLLCRPFSNSVLVYIFGRASASDGVQSSFSKSLYCTPSDVLALRNL